MTATVPLISVVIPIYNGEGDLPDLIACLWMQTYPADRVEYLLVDNNSSDRTYSQLQSYARQSADQGIKLIPLQETNIQSSYAARNQGIKQSSGDIVVFTDADCRPHPRWLEQVVQPFQQPSSTAGIVAGEVIGLPSSNWLETFADRQNTLSQKHTLAHPFRPYGQTANLAVRRQLFHQTGLFRPYLTTGGDADMCWRILADGPWTIEFAEDAIVKHRHRSTLRELKKQWQRYGRSNRYLHSLYNVDLTRELTIRYYVYRLVRWCFKELPLTLAKMAMGRADWMDTVVTPIGLFCAQARSQGQNQAQLPPNAQLIEWLT
ncbi:MAG: glycosyltransferase [Merismopedia sp. SIO2A8]|nr:glycosyltransferase [Symploca sp. SIO2B6]NET48136.1 glycosyltransferase [Merismopedia sp. SIO2A8]